MTMQSVGLHSDSKDLPKRIIQFRICLKQNVKSVEVII
jgi:hypothetical protein